jgi:hypothetical protein
MDKKENEYKRGSAEISLQHLLIKARGWYHYLCTRWTIIITLSVLGAIAGGIFSLVYKPAYIAVSTFVVEDENKNSGLSQYTGLASIIGIDLSYNSAGGIFDGDNILELYKSQGIVEKALLTQVDHNGKKMLLIDRFVDFNKLRKKWKNDPELFNLRFRRPGEGLSNPRLTRLQDSIVTEVFEDIQDDYLEVTKPDKKLNIIKVEVRSDDEFFAKTFNDQIVKNVNDFYIQTKTSKSLKNVMLLQRKTDSIQVIMNKGLSGSERQMAFNVDANKQILSELTKNLEMSKISLEKETPLVQIIDQPKFPLERNKITPLQGIVIGFLSFGLLTVLFLLLRKIGSDLINYAE